MIVKKLYRKIRFKDWNKERRVFEETKITDYLGWFLFGFIPIYLIKLDTVDKYDFKDSGEISLRPAIYETYGKLMTKDK